MEGFFICKYFLPFMVIYLHSLSHMICQCALKSSVQNLSLQVYRVVALEQVLTTIITILSVPPVYYLLFIILSLFIG